LHFSGVHRGLLPQHVDYGLERNNRETQGKKEVPLFFSWAEWNLGTDLRLNCARYLAWGHREVGGP
jgi:hypothetical protein